MSARMTSMEFKQLSVDFGKKLEKIDEDLYNAVEKGLTEEEAKTQITAGEELIAEYKKILSELDEIKSPQFKDRREEGIEDIIEFIDQIKNRK